MTMLKRLLAATVVAGALTLTLTSVPAVAATEPGPTGVDVHVTISDRTVPDDASVVVEGERPFRVGGEIVVVASGFAPQTDYAVWLHSDPVLLATVTTDAAGDARLTATIPQSVDPGTHDVRVVSSTGAEAVSEPFRIEAATAPTTDPTGPTGGGTDPEDGTSSGPGATDAASGADDLARTGAGLTGLAALAAAAVTAGVVLRRNAAQGRAQGRAANRSSRSA
ncbi:hypothetical protein [Cellulosimicrobium arenosum]|uniref:CopC domain-containing protein n=1 Tax=Cellulosimicrobium arenosum TaxID=2708133 RepID=A0A927G9X6_9MICO|nr:hypothetical protein [Cellulosimicrobium arenosum]MBD8079471.1 hypothetical protein [Cellulosimicrobium arenosum]